MIVDHWISESSDHTTEYFVFQNGSKRTCVSEAKWKDGKRTYVMTDEVKPYEYYGTQKEIKAIIEKLRKERR